MSHSPPHDRITRTRPRIGIRSSEWAHVASRNVSVDAWLYVVYGSISDPISPSPRSVCEMYTCSVPDTMIVCRNGFSGSVTNACSTCVVIGSSNPGTRDNLIHQPATATDT